MLPLKKTWLYPAIAGIALLASACANNAAPNYTTPNRTATNQTAPHTTNFDGLHTRTYDGMRARDIDGYHTRTYDGVTNRSIDGLHTRNYSGYGTTGYGTTGTTGTTGYGTTGTTGTTGYGTTGTTGTTGYGTTGMTGTTGYGATGMTGATGYGTTGHDGMRPYTAFPDGHLGTGTTGTAGIRGLTGAGTTTGTHSIYQKNASNRGGAGVMQTGMPRYGYIQTDRQHAQTAGANNVYVDRDALARAVGNVTASCPGVQRSTVLVTDEEVFVGLNTQGSDAHTAKNQARMNAMSVSPRYYKVYVTDNPNDIQEIARVASRHSNLSHARTNETTTSIDALIKRMGGTTDAEQMRARSATTNKSHMGTTGR
ncbi:YhcN/YlaJ family sporulation lipoprotein [Brevibacillus brevis]|uniref:Sporulation protein n=1 Tax=Brevibacillus brevis TaxID=1393 RepID=A0ABY9T1I7_BREBE|nr:YhcN/YlaJ family sporulation lipoprotein [Brevibacillus brevis]WNC13970.1 sporulation protein [Brevibacillus brevis]